MHNVRGSMIAAVSWIDWLIVALSVVFVAIAGTWFARRQKSSERYFIGARGIPGWAAGLSLFASIISTITFLAYPEQGYAGNWTLLLPGLMLPIVIAFVSFAIVPFYRRFIRMSAYEYLERRFGYPVRVYAAGQFLLLNLFRFALVLFLSAKAIHTFTGWNVQKLILICGVVTVIYTVSGGFEAVVWTDVLQSFIMLGGGIACVIVLLLAPDGGPTQALQIAWAAGKFRLADLSWDLHAPTIFVTISYGLFTYGGLYITNQDSVQRYLATPTTRQARRGLWFGALCCMGIWTLFMLVGTLLYSYYRLHPDQLPAAVAKDAIKVFPYFVMRHFPVGAIGLIIAAMMAASMSTLSSTINSMSLVTVCDFLRRPSRPLTDRQQLVLGRLVSMLWGVVGTLTGLSMIGIERALNFT
jgi:solute:Na+ symporter, SSS family